jgi:rRNA small subunit pseudouridine methyltransferase Nep1
MHSIAVLDAYFHHDLVKTLPEGSRRGRADIVHNCLSLCQNSIPNRKGVLRVYVHTRGDKVIEVEPGTDIPPNYIKFLNDMGTLLKGGSVPGFSVTSRNFKDLVQEIGADLVVALTPSGQERSLKELFETRSTGTVLAIIGGFPEGDYKSPVNKVADVLVSLGPRLMRVPEVLSEVLQSVPKIVNSQGPQA